MGDTKEAWDEVGQQLNALGLKLKLHVEEAKPGAKERESLEDAIRSVGEAVQHAVDAVGSAAGDEAVREDVRQVGDSFVSALNASFDDVRKSLRDLTD